MTPLTNPNAAVLLSRVSTGEQADSGLGLEAQRASMAAFCEREGLEVVGAFEDAGVSGRAPLDERAGLVAALAALVEKRAGVLLVSKLDRVARDPLLLLTIEKTVKASGAKLVSVEGEGTGSDDPSSIFMRRILAAVGEMEANLVSARTKAALAAKRSRGERVGRPAKGFAVRGGKLVRGAEWGAVRSALVLRFDEKQKLRVVASELGVSVPAASLLCRRWGSVEAFDAFTRDVDAGLLD